MGMKIKASVDLATKDETSSHSPIIFSQFINF